MLSAEEQFQQLLNQMQIPAEKRNLFVSGMIKKVIIHRKSRLWEFHLMFDQILPVQTYEYLIEQLTLAFKGIGQVVVHLTSKQSTFLEQQLLDYWPHIVKKANCPTPLLTKSFGNALPKYDGEHVRLAVIDESFYRCLNDKYLQALEEAYQQVGFPKIKFDLYIDENIGQSAANEQLLAHNEHLQNQAKKAIETHKKRQQERQQESQGNSYSNNNRSVKSKDEINLETGHFKLGSKTQFNGQLMSIIDINVPQDMVWIEGYVFVTEVRTFKNNVSLLELKITDYTSSIVVKRFAKNEQEVEAFSQIKKGMWLRLFGSVVEDKFARGELTFTAYKLEEIQAQVREDKSEEKRVELHAHTTMSTMDATNSAEEIIKQAADFGHPAIAITDHAGVQAFPDAYQAGQKYGVKVLLGVEANIVDDGVPIAYNEQHQNLAEATYVVFDVETTGLSAVYDKIIELSAVKMKDGQVIDKFEEFIDPGHPLSQTTIDLTGITDEMVQGSKTEEEVIDLFMNFANDCILVAHNASFDMGFLNTALTRHQRSEAINPVIDTLEFARFLHPEMKNHRLNTLAAKYDVKLEHHHRAIYDSEATGYLCFHFLKEANEQYKIVYHDELNNFIGGNDAYKQARPFHAILIAKNQVGLKNLFKLVSMSNVEYYYRVPRIPRSQLNKLREGLIVGSACGNGEIFEAAMQKGIEEAKKLASFYDYLEVMPKDVYQPLIAKELIKNNDELEDILKSIVQIGEEMDIPVVATGNMHYNNPEDWIYRKILVNSLGGANALNRYELPQVHFRTTEEMLAEFSYLGTEKAREIVVTNTQQVMNWCDEVVPIKDKLYTPHIEGAEDEITQLSYDKAHEIYGNPLPEIVGKRLQKELKSIIGNGFAVIYLISQKLVAKSLEDGYLVGSRGSVGSSFVATMTGITEVNPLCPHYVCPKCKYSEFYEHGEFGSGYDMPKKECPHCHVTMKSDGQDIPFETFLGFHGDKVPDIDLNFSGAYQPEAHNFTKVMFGEDHVFRAGTIQTVADKTAYGFVKMYERDEDLTYPSAELDRLSVGTSGAKRTTGQHPGGIIVIPENMDVYDFTPIQYPADDLKAEWRTTHFDFHKIHDNVLKLDILGHDDPTVIRMLQDLSGIDPKSIPPTDPEVMQIFASPDILGVTAESIYSNTGTLGIPEFGTNFVRGMLEATKPTTFAELVQISGLSHGTDVWLGNAEALIESGTATLAECIGCRDDIMVYLIHHGLEEGLAFKIMESVRKGKGIPDEWQSEMRQNNVPEWYIDSCLKIKYMFPKAHAAAYVLMALRVAYFKVHLPLLYYCAYFSVRADRFDIEAMCKGADGVKAAMKAISSKGDEATATDRDVYGTLELCNEMLERGFTFKMVDIEKSDATQFIIEDNSLLIPFNAIAGLGDNVAKAIITAREESPFLSKEDLKSRGKVSSNLIEIMDHLGILKGLPDENQLSLFDEL